MHLAIGQCWRRGDGGKIVNIVGKRGELFVDAEGTEYNHEGHGSVQETRPEEGVIVRAVLLAQCVGMSGYLTNNGHNSVPDGDVQTDVVYHTGEFRTLPSEDVVYSRVAAFRLSTVKVLGIAVGQRWETCGGEAGTIDSAFDSGGFGIRLDTGRGYGVDADGAARTKRLVDTLKQRLPDVMAPAMSSETIDTFTLFETAIGDKDHQYHGLANVLLRAFAQAATGKGKERHAGDGLKFEDQPMNTINREQGSVDGYFYQARKKMLESRGLPAGRDVAECFGAINYVAGAVLAYESWAKKS